MSYPISVVVPTKNRYKYLKSLIELIIGFDTDELELVIQDNSDNNLEIEEWLAGKNYPWLKYYYCSDKLTSIQNFDLAINNSTGDYVTFIGDDDGVTRTIVECAKWMKKNNIEALRTMKCVYNWPDLGSDGGNIYIEKKSWFIHYLNPIKELEKVLKSGCRGLGNIPLTYGGIVKREVLRSIYKDYGTFFPGGASADIANGVALCFYVKRFAALNAPIIITGTSKKTGGVSDRRRPMKFSDLPFISENVGHNWEGDFPQYWLGVYVWPESAIKALRALKQESLILYLKYDKIHASAIVRAGLKVSDLYPYCSRPINLWWELFKRKINKYMVGGINRTINLLTFGRIGYKNRKISGNQDIICAESKLVEVSKINFNELNY